MRQELEHTTIEFHIIAGATAEQLASETNLIAQLQSVEDATIVVCWSANELFTFGSKLVTSQPSNVFPRKLAAAMAPFKTKILVGPGSSKNLSAAPGFDELSQELIKPLLGVGVFQFNLIELYDTLHHRDPWHFSRAGDNTIKLTELYVDVVKAATSMAALRQVLLFSAGIAECVRIPHPSGRPRTTASSSSRDLLPIREEAPRSRTPSLGTDIEESVSDDHEYVDVAERRSRLLDRAVRGDDVDDNDTLDDKPPDLVVAYPDQPFGCYEDAHPKGQWIVVPFLNCEKQGSDAMEICRKAVYILRHDKGSLKNVDGSMSIDLMLQTIADLKGSGSNRLPIPYFMQCLQRASNKPRFENFHSSGEALWRSARSRDTPLLTLSLA